MNIIYLIGGSPRSGKTTILTEILEQKPMLAIASDVLREGIRYALTDERFININKLQIKTDVVFHRSKESADIEHMKSYSQEISQDELTWKTLKGMIAMHDKGDVPLLVEGIYITPERVQELELKNLKLKVVFLGFTEETYWDKIMEYSAKNRDWIYTKIHLENNGDDSSVRKWFEGERQKNLKIAAEAKNNGYAFFSPQESFDDYKKEVIAYLLSD